MNEPFELTLEHVHRVAGDQVSATITTTDLDVARYLLTPRTDVTWLGNTLIVTEAAVIERIHVQEPGFLRTLSFTITLTAR